MAYYSEGGAGSEDEEAFLERRKVSNEKFHELISTPEGRAAYEQMTAQRWSDIQNKRNGYQDFAGGGLIDSFFENVMDPVMDAVIEYGPYVYLAAVGGSALGLFGGGSAAAGTAAGAAGAGEAALAGGALSNAGLGLESLGFLNGMTAGGLGGAATAGGAAAAGGLGSMIGIAGGAPAVVTVGAPAAAAGGGLGLGGAAAAAGGLGLGISNLDLAGIDQAAGGIDPGVQHHTSLDSVDPVADGAANLPIGSGSSIDWLKTAQQGSNLLDGLGSIVGANRDRITNQQNQEYWDGIMNKMMGMYQPGTPEATLMEQQMNAKDAAAGRNSQYGVRATNLAGQLAGQRAQMMSSPSFYQMGAASRGHYTNSLNSLFSAAGNANGGSNALGTIGQIGNGISDIIGLGKSLFG